MTTTQPTYSDLTNWGIHLLKIASILEEKANSVSPRNPNFENLDSIRIIDDTGIEVRLKVTTEYERKLGNIKNKNSKDKRKRKDTVANYFIKEEEERIRKQHSIHTEQGIGFWTPQSRKLAKLGHDVLTPLWDIWQRFEQAPHPPYKIRQGACLRFARLIMHRVGCRLLQNWREAMTKEKFQVQWYNMGRYQWQVDSYNEWCRYMEMFRVESNRKGLAPLSSEWKQLHSVYQYKWEEQSTLRWQTWKNKWDEWLLQTNA